MFNQETTTSESIVNAWISEGYRVHVTCIDGPRNRYIKGARRYSETEQEQAKRAIAALCAEICEGAE